MFDAKTVADLITTTRGLLGLVMILLGLTQGGRALPVIVLLMILCWTGDFVDGGIARRSRRPRRTYIGDHDVYVDLFVSLCLGVYLIGAGFVGFTFGVCYLLVWVLIFWRFGLEHNLLMLMQAPIYLDLILLAMRYMPESGAWLIAWVLAATMINWRRFSHEIVPRFIDGMRALWESRHL
jgi:phosphatidylglycerophosphate synthase